jgi:hypothetical protein
VSVMKEASESPGFAVLVPVGPAAAEIDRVRDLADSLGAYESGPGWFVMVDDVLTPRGLEHAVTLPPGITPVAVHHRRLRQRTWRNGAGLCSPMMTGLQWVQANTDAAYLLKLDTDSLVIGPFDRRVRAVFAADSSVGMAGAHTHTPEGFKRTWHHHGTTVRRMLKPPFEWRHPIRWLTGRDPEPTPEPVKGMIRAALRNGYDPGEHCLGGGYVLAREALDRAAAAGYFEDLPMWLEVDLAEDVMVGMIVRATGLKLANQVKPGELFGVRWRGLPAAPATLAEQGYAVIHALKNDPNFDEATIRAFFKHRRHANAHQDTTAA